MYAKRSVSTRIAKYLFVVIIFMGIISSLSLIVMASNKSDAEAINISGSLRMQSYRLLTEMERSPDTVEQNLVRYQRSLNAEALLSVSSWICLNCPICTCILALVMSSNGFTTSRFIYQIT